MDREQQDRIEAAAFAIADKLDNGELSQVGTMEDWGFTEEEWEAVAKRVKELHYGERER